jgi:hypothetical protein
MKKAKAKAKTEAYLIRRIKLLIRIKILEIIIIRLMLKMIKKFITKINIMKKVKKKDIKL